MHLFMLVIDAAAIYWIAQIWVVFRKIKAILQLAHQSVRSLIWLTIISGCVREGGREQCVSSLTPLNFCFALSPKMWLWLCLFIDNRLLSLSANCCNWTAKMYILISSCFGQSANNLRCITTTIWTGLELCLHWFVCHLGKPRHIPARICDLPCKDAYMCLTEIVLWSTLIEPSLCPQVWTGYVWQWLDLLGNC